MPNLDDKIVGYVAFHPELEKMFCESGDCIVSVTQSAMNKYLRSSEVEPKEFEKRKTSYSQIVGGLDMGGGYAFDQESYKLFSSLANKKGLKLATKKMSPVVEGQEFMSVNLA